MLGLYQDLQLSRQVSKEVPNTRIRLVVRSLSSLESRVAPMNLDDIAQDVLKELANQKQAKEIIAVVGPTCTGKTGLAIKLAQELGLEVINADSRLIYKGMNIGTAKPDEEEMQGVPHHLIDILEPNTRYSAADYQKDFDKVIEDLRARNHERKTLAIVVGGTGLYLRTALDNLEMPPVGSDPEIKEELQTRLASEGLEPLVQELLELDPEARELVDLQNHVRVMRAIETLRLAKREGLVAKLSALRTKSAEPRFDTYYVGLNFEKRRDLYDLINKRVKIMMQRGLVHEVEALVQKYGVTDTLMGTIGYKETVEYLLAKNPDLAPEHELHNKEPGSLNQAIRSIQLKTRRYAKKQMTWLRQEGGRESKIKWYYR